MFVYYFYNFEFTSLDNVLYPRSETENLLELLHNLVDCNFVNLVLELGTGSGVIGLSIAKEFNNLNIVLTDKYRNVLDTAFKNSQFLFLKNVLFVLSDWFRSIPDAKKFDLCISNPPYLSKNNILFFYNFLKKDPLFSLFTSVNGFGALFLIIKNVFYYMNNNGFVILEHSYSQAKFVRKALLLSGFLNIQTYSDNNFLNRITIGEK